MAIDIGTKREFFFDDYILDKYNTNASHLLHTPKANEVVMLHDSRGRRTAQPITIFFTMMR